MEFNDRLYFFREVLQRVRAMFPGSHPVLGGGALRDAYHGRPIKDLDVFMRAKDHPLGLDTFFTKMQIPASSSYGLRHDLHGVWNLVMDIGGYQVQLILADFDNAKDLAGTFDIGLSQVTYDGTEVFYHPNFLMDSADKVFRIYRTDDDGSTVRSERRINRFLEKYPDFKAA